MAKKLCVAVLLATAAALSSGRRRVSLRANDNDMEAFKRRVTEVESGKRGPLAFLSDWGKELDAFIDDATMKKLGNGDKFYGKRKSNFYGAGDEGKRAAPNDDSEDYAGPSGGSYFSLDSEGRPVNRRGKLIPLKNKNKPTGE